MLISDDKKLIDIQREFNEKFPYLKIEFYSGQHRPGEGSPVDERLDSQKTIGEVRTIDEEGDMRISGRMKVGTFEQKFLEKYGLNVQVFRKSGNLWIQTTSTDSWSLNQQNRKGGSSEQAFKEKYES
jgi:hypothetical protein